MCTAVTYQTKDFYFGRTLDYEFSYGDQIAITPRNYPFSFRHAGEMNTHYAIIGMAHVAGNYPLYYDAINEKGVGMAGLNFVGNAAYADVTSDRDNVAQFEFIPWILSQCATLSEVQTLLERMTLVDTPFSEQFPLAQLHWIISDQTGSITVESMADGLHIYENPVGVLTNNPPFPYQIQRLNDFLSLSVRPQGGEFARELSLHPYSLGMGALGLPGDPSSCSRFVRAAFLLQASRKGEGVAHLFHILAAAAVVRGSVLTPAGEEEYTRYSCVIDPKEGAYYYKTYDGLQIARVSMDETAREGTQLQEFLPWQE